MKKIKVHLQKPWKYSDSPYYIYLKKNPPKNIKYIGSEKFGLILQGKNLFINNFTKRLIKNMIRKINPSIPNAHYTKYSENYNLIHCAHCISKNKFPWVADIEFSGQFWLGGRSQDYTLKQPIKKYLNSSYCKKILPWSEWSKKGILKEFPELKNKIEVVYPAVPLMYKNTKKNNKKIKILFVGRDFNIKGGIIALKVMDFLTKKYSHVEGVIVSDIPKEIYRKYASNKKIKIMGLIPQEELFNKIYPESDIFLYPTFSDTFGFAILEAQSFGLPVIAQKTKSTHTIEETIKENKTGFIVSNLESSSEKRIIKYSFVKRFIDKIELLIKNKGLRERVSKNCINEIKFGKFSIKERNKKLRKIYEEALK